MHDRIAPALPACCRWRSVCMPTGTAPLTVRTAEERCTACKQAFSEATLDV